MPKKILIVDDDTGVCNSLAILFRGEGYSVDATTDSEDAAGLLNVRRYDACLFDYKMYGLSGADLLIIAKKVNPRCPVFIISGMLNIDKVCNKKASPGMADGIINKPFDVEALLRRIESAVL